MSRSVSAMRSARGGWNTPGGAWMTGGLPTSGIGRNPSLKPPSNVFRFTSKYIIKSSNEDQVAKRKTV